MQEQEDDMTSAAEADTFLDIFETEFSESEADGFLIALDRQDFTEDEAYHVFAQLVETKRKRTWEESKEMKNARRIDRNFFDRRRGKKIGKRELKNRSRCANCGQKGHWKQDCHNAYRSKEDRLKEERKPQPKPVLFQRARLRRPRLPR
eukprot:5938745-Pyramimonas_sp.AAC.1